MFPNDDICNVDAARDAAQRLFKKYKNLADKQSPILGKQQVGKLMKDTYQAINMRKRSVYVAYNPNQEDVFSFISVFDSNNNGKIQLKDFQEFAVKYLCGSEALLGLGKTQSAKEDIKKEKVVQAQKQQPKQKNIKHLTIQAEQSQKPQVKDIFWEKQKIKQSVQSPKMANFQALKQNHLISQLSPKSKLSQKQSSISTNLGSEITSAHSSKMNQLIVKGKQLFSKHSSSPKGVTESTAPKLITATYQLFNKKNFIPSEEDVKIWMKLCDRNKDGIVEWQDYKYFLHRTYERNQGQTLQK